MEKIFVCEECSRVFEQEIIGANEDGSLIVRYKDPSAPVYLKDSIYFVCSKCEKEAEKRREHVLYILFNSVRLSVLADPNVERLLNDAIKNIKK